MIMRFKCFAFKIGVPKINFNYKNGFNLFY